MSGRRGGTARLVLAVLVAVAIAFWLGTLVGQRGEQGEGTAAPPAAAPADDPLRRSRDPFSPEILADPDFLARQRENLAALEAQCRENGGYCEEARALRAWIERQKGR